MTSNNKDFLLGVLGEIASLLHGSIASGFKILNNLLTMGFSMAVKYNQEAVAFARETGLNAKQAQAYTEVLTTRARDLGAKYGIAADAVAQLEKNLARATGRVLMLTNAEAERMVQINKLVGQETFSKFAEEMFSMGAQIDTIQDAAAKAYATAARSGLNASKASEKVAQNLGMANRLAFKNGIDGLTRMVMLSEKFGLNMQTIESVANKFMDLQEGIETSANLTMLGGAIGVYGGNPLDMSYEALADPEALAERLTHMLAGQARFDATSGIANLTVPGREYAAAMSKTLGVSMDELTKSAKKISEVNYKNAHFGDELNKLAMDEYGNVNELLRDYILNKSQIKDNRLYITNTNGEAKSVDYYRTDEEGKKEWARMTEHSKYGNLSDDEIIRQGAESLISIEETISGWMTTFSGTLAKEIVEYMSKIGQFLGDLFKMIKPHIGTIADNMKRLFEKVFNEETLSSIKKVTSSVIDFLLWLPKFLSSSWSKLLGAAAIVGLLKVVGWGVNTLTHIRMLMQTRGAGGLGGGTGTGTGAGASPTSWWGRRVANAEAAQAGRTGLWGKGWAGAKGLGGLGVAGAVVAGGLGVLNGYMGYTNANEEYERIADEIKKNNELTREEKDRKLKEAERDRAINRGEAIGGGLGTTTGAIIGGILGSFVAPGIGTMIGGSIGAMAGGGIGQFIGGGVAGLAQGNGRRGYEEGGAVGGKISGNEYSGDRVPILANSGEFVVNNEEFRKLFYMVDNINSMIMSKSLIVEPKPVDGKTIIYKAMNTDTSTVGNNTITVNDINVKFSGSVRLEGGGHYRDIDWQQITKDPAIMSYFVEALRTAFTSSSYVKPNYDTAYMLYYPSNSTINGQMKNTFQL